MAKGDANINSVAPTQVPGTVPMWQVLANNQFANRFGNQFYPQAGPGISVSPTQYAMGQIIGAPPPQGAPAQNPTNTPPDNGGTPYGPEMQRFNQPQIMSTLSQQPNSNPLLGSIGPSNPSLVTGYKMPSPMMSYK